MLTKQDVEHLKSQVESAMEVLLRAADERVSWKQIGDAPTPEAPIYAFLPGIYLSTAAQTAQPQQQDDNANDPGSKAVPLKAAVSSVPPRSQLQSQQSPLPSADASGEGDGNSENETWKLCLKTLTRHGSDWANVGLTERGIPPIVMVFQCATGCLESAGAALPAQILSNSPACRILAGLTKKIANKLGAPVDVMTEKWLPARGVRLTLTEDTGGVKVKQFNPFYWYVRELAAIQANAAIAN
ncbi:unnamed protein product [Phytophthora fragariaefolia]|uniref:Unnamed protein product n=1 Tax=Phytophthora fragariaefolia TaxID=1490495 RepID=A0A9W6XD80_9STRA|nr:unnamed protein product [Phytophthora fragariaefolia]